MTNKLLLIILTLYPIVTFADQVTINVNARVVSKTCSIVNSHVQVSMPVESIKGKKLNDSFGKTPFSISINDCSKNTSLVKLKFNTITDSNNSKLIKNTSGEEYATGIALGLYQDNQLLDVNLDEINYAIDSTLDQNDIKFDISYIKTSEQSTLGKVKGVLDFEIYYD